MCDPASIMALVGTAASVHGAKKNAKEQERAMQQQQRIQNQYRMDQNRAGAMAAQRASAATGESFTIQNDLMDQQRETMAQGAERFEMPNAQAQLNQELKKQNNQQSNEMRRTEKRGLADVASDVKGRTSQAYEGAKADAKGRSNSNAAQYGKLLAGLNAARQMPTKDGLAVGKLQQQMFPLSLKLQHEKGLAPMRTAIAGTATPVNMPNETITLDTRQGDALQGLGALVSGSGNFGSLFGTPKAPYTTGNPHR